MSAKRRAAGPAVTKTPKRPGTARRRVLRGRQVAGRRRPGRRAVAGAGAFVYVYRTTEMPDPNKDFLTQTTKVYYSGGKPRSSARSPPRSGSRSRSSEMPQHVQGRRGRPRRTAPSGPTRASTPRASCARRSTTPRASATQGASTITQQYVKILYLTSERSLQRKLKEAVLSLKIQREQSKERDPRGLPQHHLLRPRRLRRPGRRHGVLRPPGRGPHARPERGAGQRAEQPDGLRPRQRQGRQGARCSAATSTCWTGWPRPAPSPRPRPSRPPERLPKFPKIQAQSQYGGQRGHMLTLVRDELHSAGLLRRGDRRWWAADHHHLHPRGDGRGRARAWPSDQQPEGIGSPTRSCTSPSASVEPGTGALRGFYGGQDYLDSQINWAEAGGMVGSTFKPITLAAAIKDGFSLKDTFDGNSPYEFPDGPDGAQRGPAATAATTARRSPRSPRPSSRSTRRSSTWRTAWPTARTKILQGRTGPGDPPASRRRGTRASRTPAVDLRARPR